MYKDATDCETRYIFLNSANATRGTLYDFAFQFNSTDAIEFFRCNQGEEVYLTPVSCIVANDWDEINTSNNTFKIILPSNGGTFEYTITLTTGSPNILGLVADLTTKFNATIFTYWNGTTNTTLTITPTFSTTFNYLIFTLSATPSTVAFDFTMANNCAQVLGFKPILYSYTSTNVINGDFVPDISRLSEVYIYSSIVQQNYSQFKDDDFPNGLDNVQILFSFPINVNTGSNVIFNNNYQHFKQLIRSGITTIDIQIRDKNGDYIECNNSSTFVFRLDKYKTPQQQNYEKTQRITGLIY